MVKCLCTSKKSGKGAESRKAKVMILLENPAPESTSWVSDGCSHEKVRNAGRMDVTRMQDGDLN